MDIDLFVFDAITIIERNTGDTDLSVFDLVAITEGLTGDFYTWKAFTKLYLESGIIE